VAKQQTRVIIEPAERVEATPILSLAEQVYETIKDEILRAFWAPGELLLEGTLAARYGVSKTPIREALRLLLQDGWVVIMPRKGYLVRVVTLADVREVFLLRTLIEPGLVIEFARNAAPEDIERLADTLSAQRRAEETMESLRESRQFHQIIAEGARTRRGRQIVTQLADEVRRLHFLMPRSSGRPIAEAEVDEHEQIVAALRAGDGQAAATLMRQHIEDIASQMIARFGDLRG
jgi:DNA-binding GntR family transcriptional regulator